MQIQYQILFDDVASTISIHYWPILRTFNSIPVQSEIHNTDVSRMNCAVETKLVDISHGRCNAFTWCNIQLYGALTMLYNSLTVPFIRTLSVV
jgi:hypothetical protein